MYLPFSFTCMQTLIGVSAVKQQELIHRNFWTNREELGVLIDIFQMSAILTAINLFK
ncbi:hypothetical protein [uncultured Fusobacterium sp.]|uniref:hypothetical protein n=1 Tax=uncultured Fusobacterium sp. TaxID=159267 RepID=UPI0027DB1663|nr:hypothetical protein [uncultured Fusobacterium sp.]